MKMLMICLNSSFREPFQEMLLENHIEGFTKLENIKGCGRVGRHEGKSPFYGTNDLFFIGLNSQQKVNAIVSFVKELKSQYPAEGFKIFSFPVDVLI